MGSVLVVAGVPGVVGVVDVGGVLVVVGGVVVVEGGVVVMLGLDGRVVTTGGVVVVGGGGVVVVTPVTTKVPLAVCFWLVQVAVTVYEPGFALAGTAVGNCPLVAGATLEPRDVPAQKKLMIRHVGKPFQEMVNELPAGPLDGFKPTEGGTCALALPATASRSIAPATAPKNSRTTNRIGTSLPGVCSL
ncbi:hypothetical protein [Amycolatopsis sp. RTGN1]|uniref:hypothetical protein n=1 Tax=Amycolatopsis ponsaeliensis TaxID=2992142 RepID=UPI00254E9F93|nr:hypothetical protein [Amycolatopsis sp. RTGN1]